MPTPRRIFIGSSSEALKKAKLVKKELEKVEGVKAVVWNRDAFALGMTLLETIESLPFDYHGAVLVATPDRSTRRGRGRTVQAPVPNVVFEYGYLAARLTRKRVAVCQFGEVELPSDLDGLKVVKVEKQRRRAPLNKKAGQELRAWIEGMPRLAARIPPVSQVHGYSGTWNVETRFCRWRGVEMKSDDKVFFEGKTFLVLQEDGERGSGIQVGKLYVVVGEYRTTYEIVNEVLAASVDEEGTLELRVRVVRREGPKATMGEPPHDSFREELADKEFDLKLEPVDGKPKRLRGKHEFRSATKVYQRATEHWEHCGLVGASCL